MEINNDRVIDSSTHVIDTFYDKAIDHMKANGYSYAFICSIKLNRNTIQCYYTNLKKSNKFVLDPDYRSSDCCLFYDIPLQKYIYIYSKYTDDMKRSHIYISNDDRRVLLPEIEKLMKKQKWISV